MQMLFDAEECYLVLVLHFGNINILFLINLLSGALIIQIKLSNTKLI